MVRRLRHRRPAHPQRRPRRPQRDPHRVPRRPARRVRTQKRRARRARRARRVRRAGARAGCEGERRREAVDMPPRVGCGKSNCRRHSQPVDPSRAPTALQPQVQEQAAAPVPHPPADQADGGADADPLDQGNPCAAAHHAPRMLPYLTPPLAFCSPSPTQDGAQSRLVETELASAQNIADFLKKIPASS